nr:hypothetical protein [Nocardiopsis sinuspersici]
MARTRLPLPAPAAGSVGPGLPYLPAPDPGRGDHPRNLGPVVGRAARRRRVGVYVCALRAPPVRAGRAGSRTTRLRPRSGRRGGGARGQPRLVPLRTTHSSPIAPPQSTHWPAASA